MNLDTMPTPTLAEVIALYEREVARVAAMTIDEREAYRKASDERFAAAGFVNVPLQAWLDLSDADMQVIERRAALARTLRAERTRAGLTQQKLADQMETDKARIVRAEAAAKGVSVDFLLRALYAVGLTRSEVAQALAD